MKNLARSTATIGLLGLAWGSVGEAQAGQAPAAPFHYHYVDVSSSIPIGCWYFDAYKLTNDGHIYGILDPNTCETANCPYAAAVYYKGAITILRKGTAYGANQSGTVGGSIILDPNLINYYPGFYWLVTAQPGARTVLPDRTASIAW